MNHTFGFRGQPQNHVMVLAAVKFRAEQRHTLQQFPVKSTEMTDVIIGPQIIRSKIRLKMERNHVVNRLISLESGLIAINIVRSLLTDHLHILIEHTRVQHVVMIKQRDILTGGHIQTGIGVA